VKLIYLFISHFVYVNYVMLWSSNVW